MQLAVSPLLSQQLPFAEASSAMQVGQHTPNLASKPDTFASKQGLAPQVAGGKQAFGFEPITCCALCCCGIPLLGAASLLLIPAAIWLGPKVVRGIGSLFSSGQGQQAMHNGLERVERVATQAGQTLVRE